MARVGTALVQGTLERIAAPPRLQHGQHGVSHLERHPRLHGEVGLQPLHMQIRPQAHHGLGDAREHVLEIGGHHEDQ